MHQNYHWLIDSLSFTGKKISCRLQTRQDGSKHPVIWCAHSRRSPCLMWYGMPCHTHTTQPFNSPLSRTTRVSRYQKGKTNLDFTEARDSEWQWHPLGYMQVCTSLQIDNHASTPPLSFLQAGCPSCRPTNSVKALKAWNAMSFFRYFFLTLWMRYFTTVSQQMSATIKHVVNNVLPFGRTCFVCLLERGGKWEWTLTVSALARYAFMRMCTHCIHVVRQFAASV